jgi:hypothetical protein
MMEGEGPGKYRRWMTRKGAVVEGRQRRPCEREHCVGEKEIKNKKENW